MEKKRQMPAPPPPRKELSDNPVKFCNEISRLFRNKMREMEGCDGVMSQPGAHLVLSMLVIHDGINQWELVRQTFLRPPTVSVILKKMESEGLVERKSDPADLRAIRVYLTEKGRAWDRENIKRIQILDAQAMQGLTEEEIACLMALLPRIRNNLLPSEDRDEKEKERE